MTENDPLLAEFGLTSNEMTNVALAVSEFLRDESVRNAIEELHHASPDTEDRICQALMSQAFSGGYSEAGKLLLVAFTRERSNLPIQLYQLIEQVIANVGTHRDLAHWWLFISSLAASVRFQTRTCGRCSHESTMTGALLECLSSKGEMWSERIRPALDRTGAELLSHGIDLQVLGGEQESGGDFGLILDFDGKTVMPRELAGQEPRRRIVPIIFQAKRYLRPNAKVSQRNPMLRYQKDLLASNKCASAYIFYEDGSTPVERALPPLIKRVEDVVEYGTTNVLQESLDLPSYLLRCATDEAFAPAANGPGDALWMIYSKAQPGQLRELVVVSSDPQAGNRYRSSLEMLAAEINDREPPEEEPLRGD